MARKRKPVAATSKIIPRILRFYRARGVDAGALVRSLGLSPDAERAEEAALSPDDFEALLLAGSRALGDPLLAVRLPALLEWPKYSIGELAARASPTLREAFERVARYASLFYAHLSFSCEERGGELIVTHRLRAGGPGARYSNEYALASTLLHARRLAGSDLAPRRVLFAHAAPPDAEIEALREHFSTRDVTFDRGESGIAFAADDAARPSIAHDARLLATAVELAEGAVKESPPGPDFVALVAARIREALPREPVEASSVARRMRLGTRTLQRRLDEGGTTFTALLDRVRRDVALEGVRDRSLPLAEVAARAGFSDVATFGRAFRRWTGQPPGEYRKTAPVDEAARRAAVPEPEGAPRARRSGGERA